MSKNEIWLKGYTVISEVLELGVTRLCAANTLSI